MSTEGAVRVQMGPVEGAADAADGSLLAGVRARQDEEFGGVLLHEGAPMSHDGPLARTRGGKRWQTFAFGWPNRICSLYNVGTWLLILILLVVVLEHKHNTKSGGESDNAVPVLFQDAQLKHDYRGKQRMVHASKGIVASDHGRCSDMGLDILKAGGNAVDAAVTTALCLGVMNPYSSGTGGGGFILIRLANGTAKVIDAREVAPMAANSTMYNGRGKSASRYGGLAVGVPLELKGLEMAHDLYGSGVMAWSDLLKPVADIARKGFKAHPYYVATVSQPTNNARLQLNKEAGKAFLVEENGRLRPPRVGEMCCSRPAFADTLDKAAKKGGVEALFRGEWGRTLAHDIQTADPPGVITHEDLMNAVPQLKDPLRARVFGMDVLGVPPPSSSAAVLMALKFLDGYGPLDTMGDLLNHRMVEAMKHAFALRLSLGDPGADGEFLDLSQILKDMLSDEFVDQLRDSTSDAETMPFNMYGGKYNASALPKVLQDHGTSHFCVVDKDRNAVSMTTTVNLAFGSLVYSPNTGMLLNDQMDDFSRPDLKANSFGLATSVPNFVKPGKKPLSSMSPLIFHRDGEFQMAVGASGGPRIMTGVMQAVIRSLGLGRDSLRSVSDARLHHQLLPPHVSAEDWKVSSDVVFNVSQHVRTFLLSKGHYLNATAAKSVTQMIVASDSGVIGASDPRKDGAPAGY